MQLKSQQLSGRAHAIAALSLASAYLSLALTGCAGGDGGEAPPDGGFAGSFTSDNLNLDITVETIRIPADGRPRVTFTVTDDAGDPIPHAELIDVRFILAALERTGVGSPFEYLSYTTEEEDPDGTPGSGDEATQAAYDAAELGGLLENADGSFTYTFTTALPADYDRTATHQLGAQFQRASEADEETYRANLAMTFRPDGVAVTETREIVVTQSCNTCHTRLSEHGNIRREAQLCLLCHNAQSTDAETGNSLHFAEMIHKIHRGSDLPSFTIDAEPYQLSGFNDQIHDYSAVVYSKDVRNCLSCHDNAAQTDRLLDTPTLAGCRSCHDRTWYGPVDELPPSYLLHPGGPQPNSAECSNCHSPSGNQQAPLNLFHIIPTESEDAPGLALDVTDVTTFADAQETAVQITFAAAEGEGEPLLDLAALDLVGATIANPVNEYEDFLDEFFDLGARNAERGGGGVTITTVGLTFSPADVTVNVGDTVTWTTLAPEHNVAESDIADDNLWNGTGYRSGEVGEVDTFQFTFTEPGTFFYVCEPHAECCGMKGSVTVVVPEEIEVISPNGGEIWEADSTHDITWTASVGGTLQVVLQQGGADLRVLATGLDAAAGAWTWDIPANETPAADYVIRIISEQDPGVFDDSDGPFEILDPTNLPAGGTLVNNGDGTYDYTFVTRLPTGTPDTYAVALQGRREFEFDNETHDQGTATNGQLLFTIDGGIPATRRVVVEDAKCTTCHEEVREHGTLRIGINYCIMCHNPNTTDEVRRPIEALPPVSVNFKKLIHSLHRGEALEQGYTVYGFGETPHDYSEVRFSGDLRDCSICHVEGTELLPLPPEALSTVVTQDDGQTLISETLPIRAACISCHDSADSDQHALDFTDEIAGTESCADCHGEGAVYAVSLVHQIEP